MIPDLWPHQEAARESVHQAIAAGQRAGLVVLPTGTGKTALFATLARDMGEQGGTTLILVHRDELVQQTLATARRFWPQHLAAVIQGTRDEWDQRDLFTGRTADLVVASVQSLSVKRLGRMPRGLFRFVVADEAHHAVAPSWARALDHFLPKFLLGVTATPGRLDGKGLAERFGERPLYSYSLYRAIKDGRLVNITPLGIETRIDLDSVGTRDGDFSASQLAGAVNTEERNKIILAEFLKHARGRRAIGFAVDVQHAQDLARLFNANGVKSCVVHGGLKTSERRDILKDFAAARYEVCWNCEVLTEGFDDPAVSALLMARPTKSQSLYIQCVGRGLRLSPGKTDCLVLDFTDNCRRHKLAHAVDLLGREEREEDDGEENEEREEGGRQRSEPREVRIVEWRMAYVCPWPDLPNLDGYAATMEWQSAPSTPAQLKYLASFGIEAQPELTAGEVSYLIDRAKELDAAFPAPPTPQQVVFLRRHRCWREGISRKQAHKMIGQIKKAERLARAGR